MEMKKTLTCIVIAGLLLSLAACGENVTPASTEPKTETSLTESSASEDVTASADTASADTVISDADMPSLLSIAGTWYEDGDLFSQTLVIYESGVYELQYQGGGAETGNVIVEAEEHPDGYPTYWYTFYDSTGAFWNSFAVDTENDYPMDIYSGQDGALHFVRGGIGDVVFDYVETDETLTADDYVGRWACDRCTIDVQKGTGDNYDVSIVWGSSASESDEWSYTCYYDESLRALCCDSRGAHVRLTTADDGTQDVDMIDANCIGAFAIKDGLMTWHGFTEQTAETMKFERIPE